ncbi:3-oxoacyl-[acyl-carrier-protein] synthase-3 [Flavobacterium sp. 28YEA47A]|uniref:beta-ketoacyl-ACP synthase III n=1 Tax=Flavobacterium sp. 28YEA47A TaxID=3156276 RepID=UPI003513D840
MGQNIKAAITAVGGYVPDTVLDNFQLEKLVDTSDEWIVARTGIKERRILADKQKGTSDMAAAAILELLAENSIKAEEIDCVLMATSTPDKLLAPTAPVVCKKANLTNAWGLDMNAACSGFLYALSVGASFIESRRFKKVLVVGADTMSRIVDYKDRNTCILFGDGAGVVLLEPSLNHGLHDFIFKIDGSGSDFLSIPAGGSLQPVGEVSLQENLHYVKQDGRTVFKNAISSMTSSCDELLGRNGFDADAIDWIIPHQANLRIINAVADNLKVPMSKVKVNIERYGNTTAATIPLCLWDFKNDFKNGDRIFLTAFGAGFTYGSSYLTWGN